MADGVDSGAEDQILETSVTVGAHDQEVGLNLAKWLCVPAENAGEAEGFHLPRPATAARVTGPPKRSASHITASDARATEASACAAAST